MLHHGLLFCPSALTNEKGNVSKDTEDDGQSKGAGGGENGEGKLDDDGKGDGEPSNILERYFSKKQNPSKRKFHVIIQTCTRFHGNYMYFLLINAVFNKKSCQRSWRVWEKTVVKVSSTS
jgi:hypothetical protein